MKNFFSGKAGKISFYAIVCVLIISVFISLWLNLSGVLEFLKGCLSVLAPLIYAVVVVLIVNPTVHLFREKVFGFLEKEKPGQSEKSKKRLKLFLPQKILRTDKLTPNPRFSGLNSS